MGNCNSSNYIKEVQTNNAKKVPLKNYNEASKAICKIIIKEQNSNATGFFMNFSPSLKCLLTNYHVISQNLVDSNSLIEIETYSKIILKIKLNKNERYIKFFVEPIDITIIQINNSDELNKYVEFLQFDLNYIYGYKIYKNADIFTLEYTLGNELESAAGKILDVTNYLFSHNIDTDFGSSGSPIILLSNLKVIGIHRGGDADEKINYGSFIGIILEEINKDFNQELIKNNNLLPNYNNNSLNQNLNNYKKSLDIMKSKNNYIIAEFYIQSQNINEDTLILNSYEAMQRDMDESLYHYVGKSYGIDYNEKLQNEKELKECEIKINDEKIPFCYFYKFKKEGKYKISYSFKNYLKKTNYMFDDCSSLTNIDLSNFNTQNVIDMKNMFSNCSSLININLCNFNTQNVNCMSNMFYNCRSLTNIDLTFFNTQNVKNMSSMFSPLYIINKNRFT